MKFLKKLILGLFMLSFFLFIPNVYAEEKGVIGEYDTIEEATEVADKAKVDNNEEIIDTTITTEQREYIEDTQKLDETYDTESEANDMAELYKETYINDGYEEESTNIEKVDVTESDTETKDFNSIRDIYDYRNLLEEAGYDVDMDLINIGVTTEETNKTNIDRTFTSNLALMRYVLSLATRYNTFNLTYEDNSYYVVTTDEDISKSFATSREAFAYLVRLARQYDVTNSSIVYSDEPVTETEHIKKYFETEEEANEAYNNMQSDDYSLENKEIKQLSNSELNNNKENIINDLSLNNDIDPYYSIHGNNTNVNVTVKDNRGNQFTSSGTAIANEIIIDGVSHNLVAGIGVLNVPNNTVATIKGTITYCSSYRTVFGARFCTNYKTSRFETSGIINTDRNANPTLLTNNVFYYSMNGYDDATGTVKDNLVKAYSLDVDKVTTYTVPTYTVKAHIHDEDLVSQYRVFGTVSQTNLIPVYTVKIDKTRVVPKYHTEVTMVKKNVKDVYVVNYTKTIKNHNNPQTGDNIYLYVLTLILSVIGLIFISKKSTRLN